MTQPLVTAAFTVFNARATIRAALESALAQDWPNLEIVIVDDASTDDTSAIAETFISENKNGRTPVRLIRQAVNRGVATARNKAIEEARGEFIAFFDDDDVSRPERISFQYRRILDCEKQSGSDLVLCHTAREQVFPGGIRSYEATMGTEGMFFPKGRDVVDRILLGRLSPGVVGSCATCSQMARKSVYERLGGFDSRLRRSEDTDFNIRLALMGGAFAGLAEPLVVQTMTPGGEKRLAAEHEAYRALFEKHGGYLRERGWLDFCVRWQEVRYAWLRHSPAEFIMRMAGLGLAHPLKLVQKLYWCLPASDARRHYRSWRRSEERHT